MTKLTAQEKRDEQATINKLKEMQEYFINEPTLFYKVDERVTFGAHPNAVILEIFDGGKFYKIKAFGQYKRYSTWGHEQSFHYVPWTDIEKYRTIEENSTIEVFTKKDDLRLNYTNRSMGDILIKVYHFGIDFNPEYQRGNVWELNDKVNLIDSIFNNVDIGKFVFVKLPFESGTPYYEILDGKQRITTIIEFYENRFQYRGKYYKDLNFIDRNHFDDYNISQAEISNPTREQKIEYFLRLNTMGRTVDPKHIEYVKSLK